MTLEPTPTATTPGQLWVASVRQRSSDLVFRLSPYVIPITLILVALPFVCLMFFAVPASDDFCKASLAFNGEKQRTVYEFVRLYYWGWSSRWATTFLQGLLMHTDSLLAWYPAFLLMVVVSQLAGLAYFFSVVLTLRYRSAITIASLFYVVWLSTLESPAENVYWFTGSSEYMLSLTSMVLVAGLLCSRKSLWKDVCACALSFLIPAQHEMAGAFLCAFLLVGMVVARISEHPVRRWAICLALAFVSLAIVIGSPAAHIRAVEEGRHLWDFAHAPRYAHLAFMQGVEWMLNPIALLAAVYACLSLRSRETDRRPAWLSSGWWILLCVSGMAVVLLEFFGIELVGGWDLPDRAVGWLHFLFWLFFFLLVLAGRSTISTLGRSVGVRAGLIVLLALALGSSSNFRSAASDVIGPARIWRQSNAQRLSAREGVIQWAPLPQKPRLLMNSEVSTDTSWWENRCEANYLGLQSVAVIPTK